MADPVERSTMLTELLATGATYRVQPVHRIFLEALLFTGLSVVIARFVAGDSAGIVSMFLGAAALSERLREILAENRDGIYVEKLRSFTVNRRSAIQFLALFAGMTVAYAALAALLGGEERARLFRFALEAANLDQATILTRRFGSFLGVFTHNLGVVLGFAVLSFVFWSYGALLSLIWNASVWAAVITVLVQNGLQQGSDASTVILAGIAAVPHLFLEASAYVLASLAAIFASRALNKYGWRERVLWEVLRAAGVLAATAVAVLALAAVVEVHLVDLVRGT